MFAGVVDRLPGAQEFQFCEAAAAIHGLVSTSAAYVASGDLRKTADYVSDVTH